MPHDGHGGLGGELQVGLDEDLKRRFGLVPFLGGEGFVVGEFLGHPFRLGRLPEDLNFTNSPMVGMKLIGVLISPDNVRGGIRVKKISALLLALTFLLAVGVKFHALPVVDCGEMIKFAQAVFGLGSQIGHFPISVVGPGSGQTKVESRGVVAQNPTLFVVPVILQSTYDPSPLSGCGNTDPGRKSNGLARH